MTQAIDQIQPAATAVSPQQKVMAASLFGIVLGVCGIGQSWRQASLLWGFPILVAEVVIACGVAVWASLLIRYLYQAITQPQLAKNEFAHPVQGGTPALLGATTLIAAVGLAPFSNLAAWILTIAGLCWHLGFSLWHTGRLWQGGRDPAHAVPTLYLPTVAGNFTAAAALGALGKPDWAWLFLGCGFFFWLAIESIMFQRLWHQTELPAAQRPLIGIQFAPPAVCAMAWLNVVPGTTDHWVLMMWGYGLFQLILGLRMRPWLGQQPFALSYWAYTFGVASTTTVTLKLAISGVSAARDLSIPVFVGGNLFIGYLSVRSLWQWIRR